MFQEALEPYVDEFRKCQNLSMDEEAKLHCMGILKGIYKFEKEAITEFQDWTVDDPMIISYRFLRSGGKGTRIPKI